MDKSVEEYEEIIHNIFSQGDERYSNTLSENNLINFLKSDSIIIQTKDISSINQNINEKSDDIPGPQKELKLLTMHLFGEFGINLIGFEKRVSYGIPDVVGKKENKTIYVECGPCRIDKGFNYLKEENVELWVVTSEFDPKSPKISKSWLYTIKRGPNWYNSIKEHDDSIKQILKKVRNPLDTI